MSQWQEQEDRDMMNTFGPSRGLLVRGEGPYVEDSEGNRYLDFLAGIAVNVLGHADPAIVGTITEQASKLIHISNLFTSVPQLELAERLKTLAGTGDGGKVFFANSGTEANEGAFKLARLNRGPEGRRTRILSLRESFHGRTMGAIALTGKAGFQDDFEPVPGGVEHIDATIEALEHAVDDRVAAVILEPIKGEAGVHEVPDEFIRRARELTREVGALLIIDEIQTGVGRTGEWFGFQRSGITPDVITLAKGIAGGVPMGAIIAFGTAADLFHPGQHGTTFGGNPLATATANTVLEQIELRELVENARVRGNQLREAVLGLGHPLISDVRGRGLLLGIGLTQPVAPAVQASAMEQGLIINAPNDSTIRLAPPLIIDDDDVEQFTRLFSAALSTVTP